MKLVAYLLTAWIVATGVVSGADVSISATGAVGDGKTLNTSAIQAAIDQLGSQGGGTAVIPPGKFLTGALFLKPGVNLSLQAGAVLLGSTNIADYPSMPTRIEGHTQVWRPAMINASGCDGLQITGGGTIQGGGAFYWDLYWTARKANPSVTNLAVERPQNLFISDSKHVLVSGVSLRGSGFWNIHLYRCQDVTVEGVDIRSGSHSPSTDGIDVDSCQDVTIHKCYISVNDDNIAMKGSKGPGADKDTSSPPDSHIRISDCTFGHGNGMLTLGSEATDVHDVIVENCRIEGSESNTVLTVKLRPDTPQHYADIHLRNITVHAPVHLIDLRPWTQFFDLAGHAPPAQLAENISIENVSGTARAFGIINGPANSVVKNITLKNIDLQVGSAKPAIKGVRNLTMDNVKLNGTPFTSP